MILHNSGGFARRLFQAAAAGGPQPPHGLDSI